MAHCAEGWHKSQQYIYTTFGTFFSMINVLLVITLWEDSDYQTESQFDMFTVPSELTTACDQPLSKKVV